MPRQYDSVDVIGGLITVTLGLVASYISLGYPMGSTAAIGPGVFPLILGLLLIGLGLGIVLGARGREGDAPPFNLRAVVCMLAGMVAFALLIGTAGLVPAIVGCVFFSRLAEPQFRLVPVLVLGLALSLLCWAVFAFALGLPLRILGWPF